jgi:predicted lipoprotein with Yx(FWY)xxD motif
VKAGKVGSTAVLTDSKGLTLYWFVPDTSTTSKCTSSDCVKFWPPLPGPATAGPGVIGRLGTITRSDGSTQATWNGHPLYTFKGDSKPGQANGNGQNINGGVWHEVTLSGAPAPSSSKSGSGGGGGGYGY